MRSLESRQGCSRVDFLCHRNHRCIKGKARCAQRACLGLHILSFPEPQGFMVYVPKAISCFPPSNTYSGSYSGFQSQEEVGMDLDVYALERISGYLHACEGLFAGTCGCADVSKLLQGSPGALNNLLATYQFFLVQEM